MGCWPGALSIGQDGTPFLDTGLVKPEQRKQLARLLHKDDGDSEPDQTKPKHALPEPLRRELAQLVVDHEQPLTRGLGSAVRDGLQQLDDVAHELAG